MSDNDLINQDSTPTQPQEHNAAAVTGLVLGISSIFLGGLVGLLPILAIVFAGIGLAKAPKKNGKGKVQASIGLVLGILYTLVYLNNYGHLG